MNRRQKQSGLSSTWEAASGREKYLSNSKNKTLDSDDKKLNEINQDIINHQKAANDQWKEVIFTPNKPSQMAPSTKGTKLYIQGLIKFCLTDGQENKKGSQRICLSTSSAIYL